MRMQKEFRNEPVLVIAVNSGNPDYEVKRYMNKVDADLPTIVDQDRSFEQQFDFGKISLKNIIQIRVFRPDGRMAKLGIRNMTGGLSKRMGSPSWSVDPWTVPEALLPLCRAVEFGAFHRAARMCQQASNLTGKKKKVVQKLKGVVHQTAQRQLNRAHTLKESGKPWEAFQLFRRVAFWYQGYPNFTPPKQAIQALRENEQVEKELNASRVLQNIHKKRTRMGVPWKHPKVAKALRKLTRKFPDTEAAAEAKALMNP